MKKRSVRHETFVLDRVYDASPARVFAAFSDPATKARWFVGPDGWIQDDRAQDFRVGGRERLGGGPPGKPKHVFISHYMDIIPNERIVYTYEMYIEDTRTSVSVATFELKPEGKGTRLVLTEQGVFLDGHDIPGQREEGTKELLEKLGAFLAQA